MADVLKEIRILFEGDDRVSRVVNQIGGNLDQFGARIQTATQPLADMAAAVLKVEAGLAVLAAGGLVVAFNESKKFEGAVIELKKVIGDEEGVLDEARRAAIELSDTYGEFAANILRSTADYKQAGFDIQGAMTLTKNSMDLVIAGNLAAAESSEILIATLKGFKAPASEAARIVDILNEVSNNYATDVRQLGIGMGEIAPIARLMGFSFEETAGILTPIIEVFRDGSEAATALKTGLLKIVDDRKPVQDALRDIGVSQVDLSGNLRSGKDILYDVAEAFRRLTPEQQLFFAQNLVGIEQAGRMVEVFTNLAGVHEVTAVAMGAAGSAAKEVAARLESAEVSVNRFTAAAQNLAVAVGDQFRLAAKEAIDGGTDIEIALRNMVNAETFNPVLDLVGDFARQLGVDLKTIARILPEAFAGVDWSKLTESIKNVGGEVVDLFEAAFGDVDLTTVEGLWAAVQKVVDGISALNNVVAGILDAWEPFVRAVADAAEKFSDADASTQEITGKILGLGQVVNTIAGNLDALTNTLRLFSLSLATLSGTTLIQAAGGFAKIGSEIVLLSSGLGPLGVVLGTVTAAMIALDRVLAELDPKWTDHRQAVADNIDTLHGVDFGLDDISSSAAETGEVLLRQKTIWEELSEAIDGVPEAKTTAVEVKGAAFTIDEIKEINKQWAGIIDEKKVTVTATADRAAIDRTKRILIEELPDGQIVLIQTDYDAQRLASASRAVNEAFPREKEIEIKLKGEIEVEVARIEAQAKGMQAFFEYKAKVDVAEVEALFSSLENQSDNITEMFQGTGDVLKGLAGSLADVGALGKLEIFDLMEQESRRRDELLVEQRKLTDAQIKYLDARSKAMDKGEGIITISAEGLAPELELVLQKIVQLTQIKANQEGLEFLLGVT